MNQNTNLPPGCLSRDLDGPRDMAAAMDAFFERLDRRAEERREDLNLRQVAEQPVRPAQASFAGKPHTGGSSNL